jgi:benzoate/toluate 1,2-dioxygenase subunit alpha
MDLQHLKLYIDDRADEGVFRVHKDVFCDPEVFEMEMKFIFERTWNFLGLESQLAKPHDFFTTHIGRTPVMVSKDAKGRIGAFINACRHKGATVCRTVEGNAKYHVCPYHGWAYDSSGKNVDIKDRAAGCYAEAFDKENHDLLPVAKIGSYRGLIFGSLSANVPPLDEWLGELRPVLDLSMEQSPQGMEFVPGRVAYTYRANWKLQFDNGLDSYHLTTTHTSFMDIQARRRKGQGHQDARQYDWATRAAVPHGMFSFPYGHTFTWTEQPEIQKRQLYPVIDEVKARVGETRAAWMLKMRQTSLFPNMQINDGSAMILRVMRPIAVDLTEMQGYVLAPIGERPDLRAWRLRQFEDFFNPGGFATPDDTVTYEDAQRGFPAVGFQWLDGYARGMTAVRPGGNEISDSLGFRPLTHLLQPLENFNEVGLHGPYREWARLMEAGLSS